ncbi:hypothetical protein BGZ76_000401 [Entomortierella beljakovae]|nr:hypothetical protein BGZ76_000401 [Entomortierella beljakovae]
MNLQNRRVTRSVATRIRESKTLVVDIESDFRAASAPQPTAQNVVAETRKPRAIKSKGKDKKTKKVPAKKMDVPQQNIVSSEERGTQTTQDSGTQYDSTDFARDKDIKAGHPIPVKDDVSIHAPAHLEAIYRHFEGETPLATLAEIAVAQTLKSYEHSAIQNIGLLKRFFTSQEDKMLSIQQVNYCCRLLWSSVAIPISMLEKEQVSAGSVLIVDTNDLPRKGSEVGHFPATSRNQALTPTASFGKVSVTSSSNKSTTKPVKSHRCNPVSSVKPMPSTNGQFSGGKPPKQALKDTGANKAPVHSKSTLFRSKNNFIPSLPDFDFRGSSTKAASYSGNEDSCYDGNRGHDKASLGNNLYGYREQRGSYSGCRKAPNNNQKSDISRCRSNSDKENRPPEIDIPEPLFTKSSRSGKPIPEFTFEFGVSGIPTPGLETLTPEPPFRFGIDDDDDDEEYYFEDYVEEEDGGVSPFRM